MGRNSRTPTPPSFCWKQYARSERAGETDPDLALMLEKTLTGLAEGGLNDAGSGGFFRYTQTPDWREPQVEKLLEDSASLALDFQPRLSVAG